MSAVLSVTGLSAGYGRGTAVRDIDLEVRDGEVVCLLGRNGAGKTTVLRALMGLLHRVGSVQLGGVDITNWRGSRIKAAGMVWVPQEHQVIAGLTVADHFSLVDPGRSSAEMVSEAAELFPVLGERSRQDGATLSGGERKMLGIALALAARPSMILMDEPTEGVAPVIVERLMEVIAKIVGGTAVLLVEQNLDTALALGGRAYVLETGSIVEQGELAEMSCSGLLERRLAL